jgi:hypothetical protein
MTMDTLQQTPAPQADPPDRRAGRRRAIGPVGTVSRTVVGIVLLGSVVWGEHRAFVPAAWALGLVGLPTALLMGQWVRALRNPAPFQATGPVGVALNAGVFFALYLTPFNAPAIGFTSDAALIFYGASMWLAAARGYAGCEVLAISNWVLLRDDQVGCFVFGPVDHLERRGGRLI